MKQFLSLVLVNLILVIPVVSYTQINSTPGSPNNINNPMHPLNPNNPNSPNNPNNIQRRNEEMRRMNDDMRKRNEEFHKRMTKNNRMHSSTHYIPPNQVMIGTRYYQATIDGINSFMSDLQPMNPSLHSELSPYLDDLNSKRTTAKIVFYGGMITGGVMVVSSFTVFTEKNEFGQSEPNFMIMGIGSLVFTLSGIIGMAMYPGQQDVMNFVNKHNSLNPQNPMRFNMGYVPAVEDEYEFAVRFSYSMRF